MDHQLSPKIQRMIIASQRNEISEYHIYKKLATVIKGGGNKKTLEQIAEDELRHYHFWKSYTKQDASPKALTVWRYTALARVFGITFSVKLMERGEAAAQQNYAVIAKEIPEVEQVIQDENDHEQQLLNVLDEEGLRYVGSIVLGLNDALVELTGALAGFIFALQHTNLIATVGFITGVAASFSMAASEYLSTKTDNDGKHPMKAAVYTGLAYIATVFFLIFPYWIFENVYLCLGVTLTNAIIVILVFTFYVSVAKDEPFKKNFMHMASISLGVAALTFVIGILIRTFFNIEI